MRRKDKQINNPRIIQDILKIADTVRIAMIDGDEPYIVPLNYGYKDNALYIHCAKDGRKINILKTNPRVCFEIEGKSELITELDACDWTLKYQSLIGYGTIEILENRNEKIAGLDILMSQFDSKKNSYHPKYIDAIVILKLTIESISGKRSGKF
jgi:nitroimidazol reductase NimA-like FMN-containing flavoprotein (pyridoxamine 5'-phosphate oxidase superfamily)